ncbi:aminopeptidase N-like isoform X1 [Mya arenaria]|uniref:aminopeptidase N-like isoform X1 n=1 Tax=Mya arenaria TaxID=6604 RepID=UPI0022E26816|nr:aminopeptidase N-like isoform X1 [Mya arenaria]
MPGESYRLGDLNGSYKSDTSLTEKKGQNGDKMYISTAKAFILAFLAIAVAVGVGIIVHFAGGRTLECNCGFPSTASPSGGSGGSTAALEQCKDWASEGIAYICNECSQPSQAPCPTSAPVTTSRPVVTTTRDNVITTSTQGMTTTAPKIDVRIPLDLNPLLYTVELQPDMYAPLQPANFTFAGKIKILFNCRQSTNQITLHSKKLTYDGNFTVFHPNDINDDSKNMYSSHSFDMERQFLIVHTKDTLAAGENYTLEISSFHGPLLPDLAGLYLSSYTRNGATVHIATTQMQPTDARKTFPCMDEPAVKAEFDVTLVRKSHMISISNMPIISNQTRDGDWVADHFETTPKMSTYLLAFIICDFDYIEQTTENNIQYRAFSRPEALSQANYSLEVGVDILNYFEKYFNISYPLPKQDMIAVPDFSAGAMENWGLIVYRETAMLYEKGVSSEGNKQRVAVVVSHELAHQWFGNLVTPSWWDDLWLNEGFASYVEYMGVDNHHPEWRMFEQFVVEDLQDVFDFDGLISSHPVYVPVSHPDEINEIFDRISYAKGASIIRMMRFFLGDDTFQRGLSNYLSSRAFGAAFHDDLWFALGNQSIADGNAIQNVKEVMDTWTLQMNYPTVHVKHMQKGQVTLTQSRYLQDPDAKDPGKYTSPFGYKWKIPFTFTTSNMPEFNVKSNDVIMMNELTHSVSNPSIPQPGTGNWVLGNPMQYGYYRVNYDEGNWINLIRQLESNHSVIPPINRAQIINDAWSLAKSGDLDMSIALQSINYLGNEEDYIPWSAATGQLAFVSSMLARHPLFGAFSHFMRNKTQKIFDDLTMNNTDASHLESYMRSTISGLACEYDIDQCKTESTRLFAEWMGNPEKNPIDPGLKSTVYCTAIAEGGIEEWEFALNQYRTANVAAEKSRLLSALSCSKETWILSRYLNMAIDENEIRRQDSVSVIVYISRNTIGRSLAWDFFREQWDFLLTDYGAGSFGFSNLIGGITSSFNTMPHYNELKDFMESKTDLGSGARAFDQALEKTQSNIRWMNANVPVIATWLKDMGF